MVIQGEWEWPYKLCPWNSNKILVGLIAKVRGGGHSSERAYLWYREINVHEGVNLSSCLTKKKRFLQWTSQCTKWGSLIQQWPIVAVMSKVVEKDSKLLLQWSLAAQFLGDLGNNGDAEAKGPEFQFYLACSKHKVITQVWLMTCYHSHWS